MPHAIPQAMPHAIPQTHSSFYLHRAWVTTRDFVSIDMHEQAIQVTAAS